jgi:hypothetical protein
MRREIARRKEELLLTEEKFSSLEEEVESKNKKLKKVSTEHNLRNLFLQL